MSGFHPGVQTTKALTRALYFDIFSYTTTAVMWTIIKEQSQSQSGALHTESLTSRACAPSMIHPHASNLLNLSFET